MDNKLKPVEKKAIVPPQSNVVVLNEGNRLPMQAIHQWRTNVFSAVADRMCDANLSIIQKAIGMWQWHTGISLPKRSNIAILGESAMRMQITVGDNKEVIDFGIWLYLNEVRMGVRIPETILAGKPRLDEIISKCFDGELCNIIKHEPTSTFYDWIFRNGGIADKDVMLDSVSDNLKAAMLADAIANVLTHIYMAVMNALITEGGMAVTPSNGLIDATDSNQMVLEVTAVDPEQLSQVGKALTGIGIQVMGIFPQSQEKSLYLVTLDQKNQDAQITVINNVLAGLTCEALLRDTNF